MRRGVTGWEVLAVIGCLVIGLVTWSLVRALALQQSGANITQDASRLIEIGNALTASSLSDPGGAFVVPSVLASKDAHAARDHTLDTTAHFYSAMIAQNFFDHEQIVSVSEPSDNVEIKTDFDFTSYDPTGQSPTYWDDSFSADLHSLSNVSFAHVPFYGARSEMHWQSDGPSNIGLIGSRGVRDGIGMEDDPAVFRASVTPKTYLPHDQWHGAVLCADGHTETLTQFYLSDRNIKPHERKTSDNLYRVDLLHGATSPETTTDNYLTFTKAITTNPDGTLNLTVQFD